MLISIITTSRGCVFDGYGICKPAIPKTLRYAAQHIGTFWEKRPGKRRQRTEIVVARCPGSLTDARTSRGRQQNVLVALPCAIHHFVSSLVRHMDASRSRGRVASLLQCAILLMNTKWWIAQGKCYENVLLPFLWTYERPSANRGSEHDNLRYVGVACLGVFPKCPMCWAAYLSVLGMAGLQIPYPSKTQPCWS